MCFTLFTLSLSIQYWWGWQSQMLIRHRNPPLSRKFNARLALCPINLDSKWTLQTAQCYSKFELSQIRRNTNESRIQLSKLKLTHTRNVIVSCLISFVRLTNFDWDKWKYFDLVILRQWKIGKRNYGQYSRIECSDVCVRLWPFESNNEIIFLSSLPEVEVWLLRLPWSMWNTNAKHHARWSRTIF